MNRIVAEINESFNNGIVPIQFDFSEKINEDIDWSKVKYNTFYKEPDFLISRFPSGFKELAGFDKIIDTMLENVKSPLEEMEERSKITEINNIEDVVVIEDAEQESVFKLDE
jgi:hypothetical protein